MATRLIHPDFPFTDSNGNPLASGRIYFYETGTTTPKATFSDSTLTTPSTLVTNAIVLDAEGKLGVDVWGSGEYKLDIHTAADVLTTPSYDPLLGFDLSGRVVVNTIAVLTALVKAGLADTEIRQVEGYTTKGDDGGGLFQWSSSSTATAETGTIFAADEGGVGRWIRLLNPYNEVTPEMFGAKRDWNPGVAEGSATNDTAAIQAALDWKDTGTFGSFTVRLAEGGYKVTNTGARILQIQPGTRFIGANLEGTRLKCAIGSTATAFIEDSGSAAKVEIYNMALAGELNTSLTSGLRLGRRTTQFGAYGSLDNIMVRNMENATAYDLNTNIMDCGKLYSINTKDGLISQLAGVGLHVAAFFPIDYSGTGLELALGDRVDYYESEAPAADTAIPLSFLDDASVGHFLLSVQAGRDVKIAVQFDETAMLAPVIEQTTIILTGTATFGDSAAADDSGTASSGGTNSLTDTTKTWTLNQWRGGAVEITGGTGPGQWFQIASNTKETISLVTSVWTTQPDATSTYNLYYFIKKVGGGGIPFDKGGVGPGYSLDNLTVYETLRVKELIVGASSDNAGKTFEARVAVALDFPPVAAGNKQDLTVAVEGALPGMGVDVTEPTGFSALLFTKGFVSSTDTVTVRAVNLTSGAIDAPSGTFGIRVHGYV